MRLSKFTISNFRCIESVTIAPRAFTTLIGPNNAGKSGVLRAVELFLSQRYPEPDEWRRGHEAEPIVLEAEFDAIQEWEAAKPGVSALVHENRIVLRMTATLVAHSTKVDVSWECRRPKEAIDGWSDKWSDLAPEIKELAKASGILDGKAFLPSAAKERVKQLVRDRLGARVSKGAVEWTSEGISIPTALQQALPQAQMIPAVRDAESDGEPGAKTSFGLLLKSIVMPAVTTSTEYKAILDAVTTLEKKLRGDGADQIAEVRRLEEAISTRMSELIQAKVSLGIDTPDAEKFIGSNTTLRLDDGTSTRISRQGHGLQRALVFAMLEVLAAQSASAMTREGETARPRCTVLLFEEPELFMHPHLMRRLKDALARISSRTDWQVLVATHSPFLIDIADDPCSLVIHRRSDPKQPPHVVQLEKSPFVEAGREAERERLRAVLDFHPTVCEAFFARHVVLVEGDTEVAVLTRQSALTQLAGVTVESQRNTTIISCDGKWTIVPIARLLRAFGIETRAIHDVDRKNKTDAELADDLSHEFHANARIAEVLGVQQVCAVSDTFEHLLWEPGEFPQGSKDKPFRAWKRVRTLCDGKANLDHAPRLREVVRFAYRPQ